MKKLALLSVFLALPLLMSGCKTATAPLPAGAYTPLDGQINADLQAAHAAVLQYTTDVNAGKHTPTPTEKAAVNNLIMALNTADALYVNYHAALASNQSLGEPSDLQAALTAVASNLTAMGESATSLNHSLNR